MGPAVSAPGARMSRAETDGGLPQGAPVWSTWKISVGSHGTKSRPAAPKAITASISRPRRAAVRWRQGTSAAAAPTMKNSAQLWV